MGAEMCIRDRGSPDRKSTSTERRPAGGGNRYAFWQHFPKLLRLPSGRLLALQPDFLLLQLYTVGAQVTQSSNLCFFKSALQITGGGIRVGLGNKWERETMPRPRRMPSNTNASSSSIRVNPARSVGVRINKALEDGEEENLDIKPE